MSGVDTSRERVAQILASAPGLLPEVVLALLDERDEKDAAADADTVAFSQEEAIVAMGALAEAVEGWEERGGPDHRQVLTARRIITRVARSVMANDRAALEAEEAPQ